VPPAKVSPFMRPCPITNEGIDREGGVELLGYAWQFADVPSREETSVSVVIPTRDRSALVVEAVESVLAQRRAAPEVIVVDDGSTDGTCRALERFRQRLLYVYQPASGVSAARNRGAAVASGSWLAFLDSDDLWHPDKLAAQLAYHREHPSCRISQTGEIWLRDGVRVNPCRHHAKPSGDVFLPSLARCLVSPSAVLIERALFVDAGGFDESLAVCEDYDLWLRLASRLSFGLVDRPLVVKRGGHADQLSRLHWGMDRFRVAALVKLLESTPLEGARRAAAAETLRVKCTVLAAGALKRGRAEEAERYLTLAGCYDD
jgi:glycosyltransferase involved in cell wall biosynthesis